MSTIDGIINEPTVNFVGKDGFFWWVGEVESNKDPMQLGRVKVRVLGYYTNVRGETTSNLPTDDLPWATVLQHTCQPGNDNQGESSGQLQAGAIVMGFFMDGENAQMPIVIGVLRVQKSSETRDEKTFAFTGKAIEPGVAPNPATTHPMNPNATMATTKEAGFRRPSDNNTVALPNNPKADVGGKASPVNVSQKVAGSSGNPGKPRQPEKPIPAANGVGGPWKTLEYKLSYLLEDLADTAGNLIKAEDGDYLDIVSGKLHTAKALTAKLQNFLSAVFTQVISAVRAQISALAEELDLLGLLAQATGAPLFIFTIIQGAVATLLKALCMEDSKLFQYVTAPTETILSLLDGVLDSLIDKATFVLQGVQSAIDSIVCQVQGMLDSLLNVVDQVSKAVEAVEGAQEIIDAWKAGSGIFEDGTDLLKKGITSITGLIAMFIKFATGGCNRTPDGGKDTVGWYPLFGITHCTPEELEKINSIRGKNRGDCGGDGPGSILDSVFRETDPYLTAAKTFIDGSYELLIGTPGRTASVKKESSGTTRHSYNLNQNQFAEYVARKKIAEDYPDATPEEIEEKVASYTKSQNKGSKGKGDDGNLIADHTSYAGNYTEETHGDNCATIDGDYARSIEGDYFLKVTGDCHIEVGGGFFLGAEGAPKLVDNKGEKVSGSKIQKHTIRFGSDLDVTTAGSKLEIQGSELSVGSVSTKFTSNVFESSGGSISMSAGETIISGDNSIEIVTPHLIEMINFPPSKLSLGVSGIRRFVGGSVETVMKPASIGADTIPRYTIANPAGPYSGTFGATGYNCNVTTGAYNVNVAAGLIFMTSSAAATIKAGGALLLSAELTCKITAASIFLN